MIRIYALIIGYLIGNIQTGYLYKKLKNKFCADNKRKDVIGIVKKGFWIILGIAAYIIDFLKAIVATQIVLYKFIYPMVQEGGADLTVRWIYCPYVCLGAILGHYYPSYLKFKGDKGTAAYLGVVAIIFQMRTFLFFYLIALFSERHDTRSFSRTFLRVTIMIDILYIIYSYTVCRNVPIFTLNIVETCILIVVIGIIAYVNQLAYVRERLEAES